MPDKVSLTAIKDFVDGNTAIASGQVFEVLPEQVAEFVANGLVEKPAEAPATPAVPDKPDKPAEPVALAEAAAEVHADEPEEAEAPKHGKRHR